MIDELTGHDLEDYGHQIFARMQIPCIHKLNHVRLSELDPNGPHSANEHLEFDFLIPHGDVCLIGEITARSNPSETKAKYARFRRQYGIVDNLTLSANTWQLLGVPNDSLNKFRRVNELRGFFLTTKLQEFDLSLDQVPHIAVFYKSGCKLLDEYSESIGSYVRPHFFNRFDLTDTPTRRMLMIQQNTHGLIQTPDKKIASGNISLADLYTFEASPYELLPIVEVYRRDRLPSLAPLRESEYQRPLMPKKLTEIRQNLLTDPDFIFPNSILTVLSNECRYDDGTKTLTIPEKYGAISVIDGQHRLFSYAETGVKNRLGETSKIMVTAIHFRDAEEEAVQKYSARTFVEINTNQTPVRPSHLDAIAYEILGETHPRALAAQVLLRANRREGSKLYGIFDTDQSGLGFVSTGTVLTALKAITSVKRVRDLHNAQKGARFDERRGYENLFEVTIGELADPEVLIRRGVVCFEQYFNRVGRVFYLDWSTRDNRKESSLEYAKMISGFVKLLRAFIHEGLDWSDVQEELETIRTNVLKVRKMSNYDRVLFDPASPEVPDAEPSAAVDYRFLRDNRSAPTTIKKVES